MKIKTDFITNSSSSSFIVAFDKTPETRKEMQDALSGDSDDEFYGSPFGGEMHSWHQVSQTVFNDLQGQEPNEMGYLKKEFVDNWSGPRDYYDYGQSDGTFDWETYSRLSKEDAERGWDEFISKIPPQMIFYLFEYCDNDGSYFSALEHGGLFDNLHHIRISKH